MDRDDAETHADRLFDLILTHQPGLFAPASPNANGGTFVAQVLASLRKTLIDELQKQ